MKIIATFLILVSFGSAQDDDDVPTFLKWEERKLEWSDFKGTINNISPFDSELKYYISYSNSSYEIENLIVKGFIVESSIDRYLSWAKDKIRNEQYLLYNQVIFNIVELYSRYLQKDLNTTSNLSDPLDEKANHLLRSNNSKCSHKISEFQKESEYGKNNEIILKWHDKILKDLNKTPNIPFPSYNLGNHQAGMNLSLGYGGFTDPSNSYLTNTFDLVLGYEYSYRPLPIIFYLSINLGINSVKEEFTYKNKVWDKGLTTGFSIIHFSAGYPIFNSDKYSITPFVGIGIIEFAPFSSKSKYEDHNIYKANPIWGINVDYTLFKLINIVNIKEKSDLNLRYSIYVIPFNINEKIKGNSLNFTIGIDWYANFLK